MNRHRVGVVVLPNFVPLDLAVPLQVFGSWPAEFELQEPPLVNPYEVTLHAATPDVGAFGGWMTIPGALPIADLRDVDTVIVPGNGDPLSPVDPAVIGALVAAADRGARIMSTCLGAFTLAASGLLDGRRATTHWRWADELRSRHPRVVVEEQHLYVDDGNVLTSAGALASADLCLYVVAKDCGQLLANDVARLLVSPPHRDGNQTQYIRRPAMAGTGSLAPLRQWLLQHLDDEHTLESIAAHARTSVRTLTRRFSQETGDTVMNWLNAQRIARARALLEGSDYPIPIIAARVGFNSIEALRSNFQELTGTSPQRYRRTFGIPSLSETRTVTRHS